MSETVPAAPADADSAPMTKPPAKKRGRKPAGLTRANRKAPNLSVSKLITEALAVSQQRAGMSLAALKKALTAAGYDVERNNSRIKLVLKSLVSKGVLVQTRGTGASGSFRLSKKMAPEPAMGKGKKSASGKAKKLGPARDPRATKTAKANKKIKKARTAGAKKAARAVKKAKGAKVKQPRKNPGKARAGKLKAGKSKMTQQKINPRKGASKK